MTATAIDAGGPGARGTSNGPERLQAEVRADGVPAEGGRIKRRRKKLGLRCTPGQRFTITTASTPARPVAATVLAQTVAARRPTEA